VSRRGLALGTRAPASVRSRRSRVRACARKVAAVTAAHYHPLPDLIGLKALHTPRPGIRGAIADGIVSYARSFLGDLADNAFNDIESVGRALGMSRSTAFASARSYRDSGGTVGLPNVQVSEGRYAVPTPALVALLLCTSVEHRADLPDSTADHEAQLRADLA